MVIKDREAPSLGEEEGFGSRTRCLHALVPLFAASSEHTQALTLFTALGSSAGKNVLRAKHLLWKNHPKVTLCYPTPPQCPAPASTWLMEVGIVWDSPVEPEWLPQRKVLTPSTVTFHCHLLLSPSTVTFWWHQHAQQPRNQSKAVCCVFTSSVGPRLKRPLCPGVMQFSRQWDVTAIGT